MALSDQLDGAVVVGAVTILDVAHVKLVGGVVVILVSPEAVSMLPQRIGDLLLILEHLRRFY